MDEGIAKYKGMYDTEVKGREDEEPGQKAFDEKYAAQEKDFLRSAECSSKSRSGSAAGRICVLVQLRQQLLAQRVQLDLLLGRPLLLVKKRVLLWTFALKSMRLTVFLIAAVLLCS